MVRRWVQRAGASACLDPALGLAVGVALAVDRLSSPLPPGREAAAVLAVVTVAGGLSVRRTAPLAGYVVGSAGLLLDVLTTVPGAFTPYANLLGAYSLALYATRTHAWSGLAVLLATMAAYFAAARTTTTVAVDARTVVTTLMIWLALWSLGYSTARRREEQQVSRTLLHQRAVAEERTRIARELHDLIGHTVNVMLLQAGAGRRVLDRDPEKARSLLADLERGGRDALTELDRVLEVLSPRAEDDDDGPGVAVLADLARRMTGAGLRVTLVVAPEVAKLPGSLDLSVYRIVQEALTNALKHGEATAAEARLTRDGSALVVDVRDDGSGPVTGYAPGRGLLGISERAALFAGTVEHGPAGGRGFRVRVRLPLPAAAT